ncbi:protein ACCELERATED CELL DEATH 6-like isoform X2 [Spinacia oleracea]|nr:protein ACCELERATED CELL DEATH 6 isoform X3 [Spinacia oleracea]XP_056683447.1 protein ACCELERATED CELL DEATH 6-like isoform X2 [Spinacia oleracea]
MKCSNHGVGWDQLLVAAEQGHTKEMLRILRSDPELIFTADVVGETVVHVVARAGHALTITKLMQTFMRHHWMKVLLKKNVDGDTAIKHNHKEAAYRLGDRQEFAKDELNKDGISPWDLDKEAGYCSGVADIEMRLAMADIELDELYKVKWIEGTPIGVRGAFLKASANGVIKTKHIELELDRSGGNLLHIIAAKPGKVDILKLLVKFMNNSELASLPLERNKAGDTALHLALNKGRDEASALYLIEVAPKSAYLLNQDGVSPLHLAIELHYNDIVRRIFQLLPGTRIDSSIKKSLLRAKNASVVHAAVRSRNLGILERVMEELPGSIDSLNEEGWKPLSYAAYEGYLEEVHFFLNNFPDSARKCDRDGSFPIQKAVGAGHVHIVEEFISSCPLTIHDVDKRGRSILHIAVKYARPDVFSYLTKKKEVQKIFYLKDQEGKTFMDFATQLENRFKA